MKEIKSKKTNILKKILIRICRILGYELVDQDTLEYPVANKLFQSSLSEPGKRSITLGLGETKIKRKANALNIIVKTCTSVKLVTQNKDRVFGREKSEYTFRTINSLIKSADRLKEKFSNLDVRFTIIDVNSSSDDLEKILNKFSNRKFQVDKIIVDLPKESNNNMATTMASIKKSFEYAKKCDDLVYFVEDDYLHKTECLSEMLFAYEKLSTIYNNDIFLLSTDYPYLYKKIAASNILVGENIHWRTVEESLLTFMTSKKMIEKYFDKLIDMATNQNNPFEKNLHDIYDQEKCFSPIPSLSIHCANINSVFGLSPNVDVKKLWEENEN